MRLGNRISIVTGATSGIGAAIALRFAEAGAQVLAADIRWKTVEALVASALERFGRLDVMVNNAGRKSVDAALDATKTPTVQASEYKLYATEFSRRLADATMDIVGAGSQLLAEAADAPLAGRAPGSYTLTVLETIGGGTSEVQKNIIATRKLGLPKNF